MCLRGPNPAETTMPGAMSKIPDVQEAVRRLEGVAHASVRWPEMEGPATLRVEFASDADRAAVTQRVVEVLHEVGNVDLATIEVDEPPRPAGELPPEPTRGGTRTAAPRARLGPEPSAPGSTRSDASARAVFVGLSVNRGELDTVVRVSLHMGDQRVSGQATAPTTGREGPRSAAQATVTALAELLPMTVRLQSEWVEVAAATHERPEIVHSAVTAVTRGGEETVVGSSMVRRDVREASVRATLDAVNRRMARLRELL
jgi:hypothetical protein